MIVITGTIPINAAVRDEVIAAAVAMQTATMAESGCHTYRFGFAMDDPNVVMLIEEWEDQAALDAHFASPHMAAFNAQIGAMIAGAPNLTRFEVESSRPLFG